MSTRRQCHAPSISDDPCRAAPLRDSLFCRMHDPDHAVEVAEGRRLGGQRRRKEALITAAYDVQDVSSLEGLRRILEIAVFDMVGAENTAKRTQALGQLVRVGYDLYKGEELERSFQSLQAVLSARR